MVPLLDLSLTHEPSDEKESYGYFASGRIIIAVAALFFFALSSLVF